MFAALYPNRLMTEPRLVLRMLEADVGFADARLGGGFIRSPLSLSLSSGGCALPCRGVTSWSWS